MFWIWEIVGAQHMISIQKGRFPSHKNKPPGASGHFYSTTLLFKELSKFIWSFLAE